MAGDAGWRRFGRTRNGRAALLAAMIAVGIGVALLAARGGPAPGASAPPRADAVPYDGRSPREPAGAEQRVLLELQRPALGGLEDVATMDVAEQKAYVVSLRKEAAALRGALRARGVRFSEVSGFERVWNGFAATVRTRDLADISSLGVRAHPVRRFYPAVSEPAVSGGRSSSTPPAPPPEQEPVALLASGVSRGPSVEAGFDAVDGDSIAEGEADPRDARRREASGTALAGVLLRAGERVRPLRVSALRASPGAAPVEEYASSDELLGGLERAVDPDRDGDAADRVAVALVGVNAPYAGFTRSPEARAVGAASALGTLVVAPAGNEGRARPPSGTVGSPGASAEALAVGALEGAASVPRAELRVDGERLGDAAILSGVPPAGELARSGTVTASSASALLRPGAPRLRNTLAVIRAPDAPGAFAAAAATAGASAVLLAEPRAGRSLPAMPAGLSIAPVLGVTGPAAKAVLELKARSRMTVGKPRPPARSRVAGPELSRFTSRGPALDGTPKPDLAAPGAARTADAAGRPAVVGGTAVAAAHVAVEAARLARARPDATPAQLKAALMAAADGGGGESLGLQAAGSGAGRLRRPPASAPLVVRATPQPLTSRTVRLRTERPTTLRLGATADAGAAPRITPPRVRTPGKVTLSLASRPGAFSTGRLTAADQAGRQVLSLPYAVADGVPRPVAVGNLIVSRRRGRVAGVRFSLGAFERGDPLGSGTAFEPVERLDLELVRADGTVARRLTPPGGARELLPAEYAYTLPRGVLSRLAAGSLQFRVRARGPRQAEPSERSSTSFKAR